MIPKKYASYLFSFFMALLMSCIMSLVISIHNIGWIEGILYIWLDAWSFAFIIAFPTVLLVTPVVRKLVGICVRQED